MSFQVHPNISIEIDPDLEADLRQAISQAEAENAGDDDAVIRAALEKLVGSTVTFRNLGDGQQGDTTFDLVFYAGTDPDKAAQAAYSQWNIVFANVPDDGKYGTGLAMVETENGIWMLVKATVEKAGTEDKPEPATVTGISISAQPKKTQYNPGDPFNPAGMEITVTYSDGSTKTISGDYSSKGVTWSPAKIDADTTVTITYGGKNATVEVKLITLDRIEVSGSYQKEYTVDESFDPDGMKVTAVYSNGHKEPITDNYTIKIGNDTITSGHTFNTAGDYTLTVTYDDMTSDPVNIHVKDKDGYHEDNGNYVVTEPEGLQKLFAAHTTNDFAGKTITLDKNLAYIVDTTDRPLAETFKGELHGNGATVTITGGIQGLFNEIGTGGKVLNVDIEVSGTISGGGHIGAVAGSNYGTIQSCDVTVSKQIQVDSNIGTGAAYSGGIVGHNNFGKIDEKCTVTVKTGGSITATNTNAAAYAGGIMGRNFNNLEMLPAIGYDGFICANAYQDDGKYIASVTTTPITTGTTGTAVIYPDYLPKNT